MAYKIEKTFEQRKNESSRIRAKYLDRVPVILEKFSNKDIDIDKKKYLVPDDFTIGQLAYVIRKRIRISPEKSMFLFVNNTIPNISQNIISLYQEHKDLDGFLYFTYTTESMTFG